MEKSVCLKLTKIIQDNDYYFADIVNKISVNA